MIEILRDHNQPAQILACLSSQIETKISAINFKMNQRGVSELSQIEPFLWHIRHTCHAHG